MRIASIAKAFSGAVALHLVQEGLLGLNDTIGERLPGMMPPAWSAVTVREMLNHTSGLPDYTQSAAFRKQAMTNPRGYVSPTGIIDWVRKDGLMFTPGSRYEYSNTDNIVVGLIAQQVAGESYGHLLSTLVFRPAKLTQTTFPTRRVSLPAPFIHGYAVQPGKPPQDVTTFLSPSGAWASGAIVSTPADLGAFIRADLGGRFFGQAQQARSSYGSSVALRARPVPAQTRRGWRSSVTGRAAGPSTATPATSPDTCNGQPQLPTAGARSRHR